MKKTLNLFLLLSFLFLQFTNAQIVNPNPELEDPRPSDCIQTEAEVKLSCEDITVTNITSTSAVVNIPTPSDCIDPYYFVCYKEAGTTGWSCDFYDTPEVSLTGLDPCTEYDFYVYLRCCNNWEGPCFSTFTTLGEQPNPPPCDEITVTNITTSSATVNIPTPSDCVDPFYYICWREVGTTSWSCQSSTTAQVTVTDLDSCTEYEFFVYVRCCNWWSQVSCTKTFTTLGERPDPPACDEITVSNITSTTATVNIPTPSDCVDPYYYICAREVGSGAWSCQSSTTAQVTLTDLDPCTDYEFFVYVRCCGIWSYASCTKTFTTSGDLPSTPNCGDLVVNDITCNSAELCIDPAPECSSDGAMYQFAWREFGTTSWTFSSAVSDACYEVTGLDECTKYEFRVRVKCCNTWSSWSCVKNFFTITCTVPCESIEVTSQTDNSITVCVNEDLLECTDGYRFQYRSPGGAWITLAPQFDPCVTISGLDPCVEYEIRVKLYCCESWSEWSCIVSHSTDCCEPPNCNDISVNFITSNSAYVCSPIVEDACAYNIQVRKWGTQFWADYGFSSNNCVDVIGLDKCTWYEVRVRIRCCDGEEVSEFSCTRYFRTAGCCFKINEEVAACYNSDGSLVDVNGSYSLEIDEECEVEVIDVCWSVSYDGGTDMSPIPCNDGTFQAHLTAETIQSELLTITAEITLSDHTTVIETKDFNMTDCRNEADGRSSDNTSIDNATINYSFKATNYPNPFQDQTTIEYQLSKEGIVHLRVVDVNGKVVSQLIQGEVRAAGTYQTVFNAENLTEGFYMYQLNVDGKVQVGKMIITK